MPNLLGSIDRDLEKNDKTYRSISRYQRQRNSLIPIGSAEFDDVLEFSGGNPSTPDKMHTSGRSALIWFIGSLVVSTVERISPPNCLFLSGSWRGSKESALSGG